MQILPRSKFWIYITLIALCLSFNESSKPVTAQFRSRVPQTAKLRGRMSVNEAQQTVVPLTSGTAQTGTVSAPSQAGSCSFGATQYSIAVTAETKRLLVNLTGDQDVDLYARFNSQIAIGTNGLLADYGADSAETTEEFAITANVLPPLQSGTYYLGVVNCGTRAANVTITATTSNGGGLITEELSTDDGSADDAFVGDGLHYLNRFTPLQYPAQLQKIRIQLAPLQGLPNPTGAQIRLLAFNLPSGSAPPTALPATLLLDRKVTLTGITGLRFYDFDVTELPVINDGDWYVGYQAPTPAAGVGVLLDQSSEPQRRFLFAGASGGPFQLDTEENLMVRAVVVSGRAPSAVASVSAASYSDGVLAANSIVAAFGAKLATTTAIGATLPLPTTLAGTTVKLRDSANVERLAPLFFVSPAQINYLIPSGTANGAVTVTVTSGDATVTTGTLNLAGVAPGLFAANATGQGPANGFVLRVKADGSQVTEPLINFDTALNRFVLVPVDVSNALEQVFLILFGTGFSSYSSSSNGTVKLGGQDAELLYAGPQGQLAGLDQLNVRVPRALAGRGEIDVAFAAGGRTANLVKANVK